jgi:hypothetical protein
MIYLLMLELNVGINPGRRVWCWEGGIERLCFCKFFNIYIYLYINDLLACRGLLDFLHFTLKWAGFPRFT